MKSIAVVSKVLNGKLVRNKGMIANAVKHFEGKNVEVIIKMKRKYRSSPQNAYYFGVIIPIAVNAIYNEWGEIWSKEKTHDFFKNRFLFDERVNEQTAEIIQTPKSTTDNSTIEQEEYHLKCVEPKSEEQDLIEKLDLIISEEEVIKQLKELIANGDLRAIQLYLNYRRGRPIETKDITINEDLPLFID